MIGTSTSRLEIQLTKDLKYEETKGLMNVEAIHHKLGKM